MTSKFKIAIIGEMPFSGYSGGRYHAWIMAEALAEQGNDVYIVTNNKPEFANDFNDYPRNRNMVLVIVNNFLNIEIRDIELDFVICVPSLNDIKTLCYSSLILALKKKAKFAFINFETPNWYGLYSQMNRSENSYKILQNICRFGCIVFSSAQESKKYAELYYNKYPKKTTHYVWSPPINTVVADSVIEEKKNQILVFLRISDRHKGGNDFLALLGEYMRGYTCVCIVGNGKIDSSFYIEANEKASTYGINIKFEKSLSDKRKFEELKKSKLLLFPSHFEGYGYPPVEAVYCGTKCIAYDLPVLREISGDNLIYCERNNIEKMRQMSEKALLNNLSAPIILDTTDFFIQSERLQSILEECANSRGIVTRGNWLIRAEYFLKSYVIRKGFYISKTISYCIQNNISISNKIDPQKEKWNVVKPQIKGKRIYIWGAGKLWMELSNRYARLLQIEGIIDKSSNKNGQVDPATKKQIISPNEFSKIDKTNIVVMISNIEYFDEIVDTLDNMNISEYHSISMIEMNRYIYRLCSHYKR